MHQGIKVIYVRRQNETIFLFTKATNKYFIKDFLLLEFKLFLKWYFFRVIYNYSVSKEIPFIVQYCFLKDTVM